MSSRAPFIGFALAISVLAQPGAAQDGPQGYGQDAVRLRAAALAYLDEAIEAAALQAGAATAAGDPAFRKLLGPDARWLQPKIKRFVGAPLAHFSLYGAHAVQVSDTQIARDAARVSVTVSYEQVPGFDWPAQVDFIWNDGAWRIREVGLVRRRALPPSASPDDVLVAYLAGMQAAVTRHATLPQRSWIEQTLQSHWAVGGGGFWRQRSDCPVAIRETCLGARIGGANLWAALALDRDKAVEITDFRFAPDGPVGEITITIPRRTMTETRLFEVRFAQDKRHGWQIASLTPKRDNAQPAAVALDLDDTDGLSLVTTLLDALTGPQAPEPAALMANLKIIEPFFTESRDGRKAAAQLVNLNLMLTAMGARLDSREIRRDGAARIRVTYEANGGRVPDLVFIIEATDSGPKISGVLRE